MTEIPAELVEQAQKYHHELIDAVSQLTTSCSRPTSRARSRSRPRAAARSAHGDPRRRAHPCCSARLQEQGRAAAARRGRRLSSFPARRAADRGHRPQDRHRDEREARRSRALRRAGVQDHADPVRGNLTTSASTPARSRRATVLQPDDGKNERIGRILHMHANHREEIEEIVAGDIAAASASRHGHRRHAVRREAPDLSSR